MTLDLLAYVRFAIMLGSSRGQAYRHWERHNPGFDRDVFSRVWLATRRSQELAALLEEADGG